MSDLKSRKSAVSDVPGLAYFTAEAEKSAKPAPAPQRRDLDALEQMFGYYAH